MKPPRKLRPVRPKLPLKGRTTSVPVPVKKPTKGRATPVPVVKKPTKGRATPVPARSLRPQGRMSTIVSSKKTVVKKPTMKKPLVKKTAVRKLTVKPTKRPSLDEQEEKLKVTKQFLKWQNSYKNNKNADANTYEFPPESAIRKWWKSKGYSMNGDRKLKN